MSDSQSQIDSSESQLSANTIIYPESELATPAPLYKWDVPNTDKIYGAIIMCAKTSRYLLVLGREAKKWSFPKGHSKENETEYECLVREMIEETGFGNLPDPLKKTKLKVGTYFKIRVDEEFEIKPRDKKEIVTGRWVTVEETRGMRLNIDTNTYFRGLLSKGPLKPQPAILMHKSEESQDPDTHEVPETSPETSPETPPETSDIIDKILDKIDIL
jgi:8-oxo-dGTP pyrophosphatase MutT (NUDIX family)